MVKKTLYVSFNKVNLNFFYKNVLAFYEKNGFMIFYDIGSIKGKPRKTIDELRNKFLIIGDEIVRSKIKTFRLAWIIWVRRLDQMGILTNIISCSWDKSNGRISSKYDNLLTNNPSYIIKIHIIIYYV